MSKRYTKICMLKGRQDVEGAPVTIKTGVLLRNNETGDILGQVKFENVSYKKIIALNIELKTYDKKGRQIGRTVEHQYLNLSAYSYMEFGSQETIRLPNKGARSFRLKVTKVVFEDKSIWVEEEGGVKVEEHGYVWKKKRILFMTAASIIVVMIAAFLIGNNIVVPEMKYKKAQELLEAGDYDRAIWAFEELGDYKAAKEYIQGAEGQIKEQTLEEKYNQGEKLLADGKIAEAAMTFATAEYYADARERSMALWDTILKRETITSGMTHTVGLKKDGTVAVVGLEDSRQGETGSWTDIIAISANWKYTMGLKADGTVVVAGEKYDKAIEDNWNDIVSIATSASTKWYSVAAGLKIDGTVVAASVNEEWEYEVSDWTDIIAIAVGGRHVVGLKADGTVVAAGRNNSEQYDVSNWKDIVAIAASDNHTVGLKADGTVVSTVSFLVGRDWTDIVAISAGYRYTVGLKADGTVVAVGENGKGQCDVNGWTDIVAISAGVDHTIGLKADGTVVATGNNEYGQCNVSNFSDIKLP